MRPGSLAALGWWLGSWGRRAGLDFVDLWFLGLRVATLAVGTAWWALAPAGVDVPPLPVLAAFLAFSVVLYVLNARRPGNLAFLYRIALVFDLILIFFTVRATGGFASEVYLAFVLLVALHAFYFGLRTGLGVAAAAAGLYALVGDWAPPPTFLLRVAFLGLVGLCMGVLAEQARARQRVVEEQQERLLRSERLATLGEIAAGLVHELRNPLAGISGALHVLSGGLSPDGEQGRLLRDVQAEIKRMNRTLTELLQHARPAEPQRIAVEINGLLEQTLNFVPQRDIQVVRRFDPALPPVQVDPSLLHQAFLNILVNARQAMPRGGCLTLETRSGLTAQWFVEVKISDTGVGIAMPDLSRIFQPFFTTKAQGTGLGLAIASRVIEQHGGRITVDSALGRGTTFTITLPITTPPDGVRSESYAVQSAGR